MEKHDTISGYHFYEMRILLNKLCRGNFLFSLLLPFFIFISGCSSNLILQSANINPKPQAILNEKTSAYFIDSITVPRLMKERIGKKRNHVGNFLAWIYTDHVELANWCEKEWEIFLKRHGNTVVSDFDKADFIIQCIVINIWIEKKYEWKYNDDFGAHITMNVKITERSTDKKVFNRTLKYHFNTERAYERNNEISDEQMFNFCLSTVFQNALEKIKFVSQTN